MINYQKKYWVFIIISFILIQCTSNSSKKNTNNNIEEQTTLKQAITYYADGNYNESVKLLKILENQNSINPEVYFYLALNYYDLKNLDISEVYCLKSLKLNPNQAKVYSELSAINFNKKNFSKAEEYAIEAIKNDPKNGNSYINYSSTLAMLGKKEESEKQLYEAAKVDPESILNLANTYLMQHKNPKAALYLLFILNKLYDSDPIVLLNIGNILRMINDREKAIEYLKKAYDVTDKNHNMFKIIYSSYFRTLLNNKKYDEIVNNALEKFVDSSSYFFLALAYFKQKNNGKFIEYANKYFELRNEKKPESLIKWAEDQFNSN
ncbi:MAG: hypothetical protein A2Y41_03940 [Spirochaetes bacterium GWB1_36_13]|nr:MAG: hypothetical protein A2Y41_03940 [Spirochaetes bacterium GWB1_36_13]